MRKRFLILTIIVLLSTLLVVPGCGKKESAASGMEMDLFSLLPDNAMGVFSVNVKKLTSMEFFDKMIQESEKESADKPGKVFENYADFVSKTGIDPKKDIQAMVMGLYGKMGVGEPEVVFLVNINYNKDTLLKIIKEKGGEITEETYKDVAMFKIKDDKGKDMSFAFVSPTLIAGGNPALLNRVIDLHKGSGNNILAAGKMKEYLSKMKGGAIASFVFGLPDEVKKVHDSGMFKMDLTKAEAITGYVDYANKTWDVELKMISYNEEANQQLVSTLNGLKMMAGAAGPEVAELVNNLTLTASSDSVKLSVSMTEELLEKLKTKIEERTKGLAQPMPTEEPTEAEPTETEQE